MPRLRLLLALLLPACAVDHINTGDSGSTADGGSSDGGSLDGGSSDGGTESDGGSSDGGSSDGGSTGDTESPRITGGDAWCYPHTVGHSDFIWRIAVTADDPQGAASLEGYWDGITVLQGSAPVGSSTLTCDSDGACSGSFTDTQLGTTCGSASSYLVRVQVRDEDDNWSSPQDLVPRECPSEDPC